MKNDPYEIKARFKSVCSETGKVIEKGERCVYYPLSKKVYHETSKTAESFRSWKFDLDLGYNY